MPSQEEKDQIAEARLANPDIPLGREEEYVYVLSLIPDLKSRLSIWAFMIDFDAMEDEVITKLLTHGLLTGLWEFVISKVRRGSNPQKIQFYQVIPILGFVFLDFMGLDPPPPPPPQVRNACYHLT